MASGDESKWPRIGLTNNKFCLAPRKNAQLCNIYCYLLRKHLMRNCTQNAAKILKTLWSPTWLSTPPPVCSSPPPHLLPKAENCSPSIHPHFAQGLPACFPLLFWSASATHSLSLCLFTQTGLPATLFLVPITTGSKMQAQEPVPFQGGEETGTLPNPKLSPRQMTLNERLRVGQSCRNWGSRGSSDKGTQPLWCPLQAGTGPRVGVGCICTELRHSPCPWC